MRPLDDEVERVCLPLEAGRKEKGGGRAGAGRKRQRWRPSNWQRLEGEPWIEEISDSPQREERWRADDATTPRPGPRRTAEVRPRGRRLRGCPAAAFDVEVVTFNGSGMPQAIDALRTLREGSKKVSAVLIQEHLTRGDGLADLQHAAKRVGFKVGPTEAAQGKGGGPSAGVAVAVPSHRGWGAIQGPCWDLSPPASPGRLVGAWVQAGPRGGMCCFSLYLWSAEGMSRRNVGLVEAALAAASTCGGAWVIGADWNVTPKELREATGKLLDRAGAVIRAPPEPTCYPPTGRPRTLDFFLVDGRVGNAVSEAEVETSVVGSPHRAVKITVRGKEVGGLVQMVRKPRMLPRQRPIGCPRRPLVPGGREEEGGEVADGDGEARDLDTEWRHIAHCMEAELCRECDCVNGDGTPDGRYMGRGHGLQLVRRPLLPPRTTARHGRADAHLHQLTWTLNRMEEIVYLASRGGEDGENTQGGCSGSGWCTRWANGTGAWSSWRRGTGNGQGSWSSVAD